jgi:hypothetical protein
MQGENVYFVEKILKKQTHPKLRYLVKWEGYDESESTWEPLENLMNIKPIVEAFEEKLIQRKKRFRDNYNSNKKTDTSSSQNHSYERDEDHQEDKKTCNGRNNNLQNNLNNNDNFRDEVEEGLKPDKVVNAKLISNKLYCLVRFQERSDGIVPDDCYLPSDYLSEKFPGILIDFYESKLKFV